MGTTTTTTRHDVAIVGARAGGGALALLLARLGHDVVVVDRALLPSDTLSTHALSRSGVVQLNRWGLLGEVLASGAPAIRQVGFHTARGSTFRTVKDRAGVDLMVAPRRTVLDAIVARSAAAAGATLRLGTTVTGLRRDPADGTTVTGIDAKGLDGETLAIDARVVVGADGVRSFVAREVGAELAQVRPPHGATYYAYYGGAAWPGIEFFVADQGMAGIFPTNRGEACIWVCVPGDQALRTTHQPLGSRASGGRAEARVAGFDALVERISPALAARLRSARRTSLVRGAVGLPNQVRQAHGPGWALVGDAFYHRDPITGHGLSDAYRDAELLATALDGHLHGGRPLRRALADYEHEATEALQEIFDISCALGAFPPVDEFVALQRQLSDAIDVEASALAARPVPGSCCLSVA